MGQKLSLTDRAIFLVISRIITTGFKLAPGILLARLLSKAEYGTFLQVMLIIQSVANLMMIGIPKGIFYFVAKSDKKRDVLIHSLGLLTLMGAVGSVAVFAFRHELGRFLNNPAFAAVGLYVALSLFLEIPQTAANAVFISTGRVLTVAMLNLAEGGFFAVVTVLAVILGGGVRELLIGMTLVNAGSLAYTVCMISEVPQESKWKFDLSFYRPFLLYTLPIATGSLLIVVGRYLDKFIISHWFTVEQFAIYSRGTFDVPLGPIIVFPIFSILIEQIIVQFDKGDYEGVLKIWHRSLRRIALIVFPIFCFLFVMSEEFVTFLYSDAFRESGNIFRVYLLLLPLQITAFDVVLQSMGQPQRVLWVSAASIALNAVFALLMVPTLGMYGAVWALVATTVITAIFYLYLIKLPLKRKYAEMYPWKDLAGIMVVSLLATIGPMWVHWVHPGKFLALSIGGVLYVAVYALLAIGWKVANEEEIAIFKKWISLKVLSAR